MIAPVGCSALRGNWNITELSPSTLHPKERGCGKRGEQSVVIILLAHVLHSKGVFKTCLALPEFKDVGFISLFIT